MQIKSYCVTVMDNWTPTRTFWTLRSALAHAATHLGYSYVWKWNRAAQKWELLEHMRFEDRVGAYVNDLKPTFTRYHAHNPTPE